ncbi:unnamed protein product [Cuscuta epithymum]|uniref:Glucan endo-1,3-beta-D-glucosidase n=2 Tax=Cuscuta epithymum TaxID=186058 RepID=A0AAV0C3D5_9ASTE|nr:unnamed protein product [Cuscuta epithymum]
MNQLHPFPYMAFILFFIGLLHITGVQSVGVCYGKNGDNLPSESDTINLYKRNGIQALRVYSADSKVFDALRGTEIDVIVDVSNDRLPELADPAGATRWVQNNIVPYSDVSFKYVAVGNEVYSKNSDSSQYVKYVLPALKNVHDALSAAGLQGRIRATTATYSAVLTNTYPPNQGVFNDDAKDLMNPIVKFLAEKGSPLLANIYPYFGRKGDPAHNTLAYALFTETNPNSAGYRNLFDAMLDSMRAAVQKAGGQNVRIVVSESGWPSAGGFDASPENAGTYYKKLIDHVKRNSIETYLFAMYDENKKSGDEIERHFGLFHPGQSSKYQIALN